MSSKTYWRDRELEWKKKRLKDEKQYADEIQEIYANMMDSVEKVVLCQDLRQLKYLFF